MGDDARKTAETVPQSRPEEGLRLHVGLVIAVGSSAFFTGVGSTLLVWAVAGPRRAPPDPPPVTTVVTAEPTQAAASSSDPSQPPVRVGTSEPTSAGAEAAARRALARFRDGIGACVRDVIGVLPGTSPAVPITMKLMKNGLYTSAPAEWKTPVFACARYAETGPQAYQIQWQRGPSPNEGTGVAWLDDDRDGKPDRAFGFRARLVQKKDVTFDEIGPINPVPKLYQAR